MTLEGQTGHTKDLETYIEKRLRIDDIVLFGELQPQLLFKATGVFMWVILVVDILNREWQRGGLALRKRLAELPSGLSDLFKDIIRRDTDNMEQLVLCIRWIIFSKRPLQPAELYHALWSGLQPKGLVDDQIPVNSDMSNQISIFVISSSKGLAEITASQPPKVQFIHESVRDFLIKDKGLFELCPGLEQDWDASSHEVLRQCCNFYLNRVKYIHGMFGAPPYSDEIFTADYTDLNVSLYSFLEYAAQHVLHHANAAAEVVPQDQFLSAFEFKNWVQIYDRFEKFANRRYGLGVGLHYILADQGCSRLIRARMQDKPDFHSIKGGRYRYPIFAALANGHKDTVAALLGISSTIEDGVDMTDGLNHRKDLIGYKRETPLTWAASQGRLGIMNNLVRICPKSEIEMRNAWGRTPLQVAIKNGHEACAASLFEVGAIVDMVNFGSELLSFAAINGLEGILSLLIAMGASVIPDSSYDLPLLFAVSAGREATVRLLVGAGANANASSNIWDVTPLEWAMKNGHETIVHILREKGTIEQSKAHL